MRQLIPQIALLSAVGLGVLLATQQHEPSEPPKAAPVIGSVAAVPSDVPARIDATVELISGLQEQVDALRMELASFRENQANPAALLRAAEEMSAEQPGMSDAIASYQSTLRAAEDEQAVFERRLASDSPDLEFSQVLEASISQAASEVADSELAGFEVTALDCRASGCELSVEIQNASQATVMPLLIDSQLEGSGRVRMVTEQGEGKLRIVIERV